MSYPITKNSNNTYILSESAFIALWFSAPKPYESKDTERHADHIHIDMNFLGLFVYATLTSTDHETFVKQVMRHKIITQNLYSGFGKNTGKLCLAAVGERNKLAILQKRLNCCMENASNALVTSPQLIEHEINIDPLGLVSLEQSNKSTLIDKLLNFAPQW